MQSAGPWKGRDVPRKGHGNPPPDGKEEAYRQRSMPALNYHQYTAGSSPIVAYGVESQIETPASKTKREFMVSPDERMPLGC